MTISLVSFTIPWIRCVFRMDSLNKLKILISEEIQHLSSPVQIFRQNSCCSESLQNCVSIYILFSQCPSYSIILHCVVYMGKVYATVTLYYFLFQPWPFNLDPLFFHLEWKWQCEESDITNLNSGTSNIEKMLRTYESLCNTHYNDNLYNWYKISLWLIFNR